MLIEIKNWKTKKVIFSYDCEDNTTKKTVEEAVKRGADLSYADLRGADLGYADLRGADLSFADIYHADISHADISYADLRYADLSRTNLMFADLSRTYIRNTTLVHADLRYADFHNAILDGAILDCAKINYPMNIPEGEFIAYKKVSEYIVKLKILADSKRSRATTDKCRCDKALVLGFETLEGKPLDIKEVTNNKYSFAVCTYKVGEIVYADWWDDNRWNECSHGIHFFLDRQSAVEY